MKYYNRDDCRRYYNNCYIKYKKEIYYVTDFRTYEESLKIVLIDSFGDKRIVSVFDPNLNFSYPKMGYVNVNNGCVFLSRTINRNYKKSFCLDFVKTFFPPKILYPGEWEIVKNLFDQREYPSYKEVMETVQNDPLKFLSLAKAFDRNYAILKTEKDISLYRKNNLIGKIDQSGHCVLNEKGYVYDVELAELGVKL